MKKKKLAAALLAGAMAVTSLAGCGGSGTAATADTGSTADSGTAADSGDTATSGDTKHIVVTWVYYTSVASDLQEVTDAVNAITVPKIGVEVEFMPMSINDTFTKYSTYIASGERMDAMLLLFQDPLQYYIMDRWRS